PDRHLLYGLEDGTVVSWNLRLQREIDRWRGHDQSITSLACNAKRRLVASTALDGLVRVWELETGKLVSSLEPEIGEVHSVAWGEDGRMLAASGQRGVVLWDSQGEAEPRRISDHLLSTSC